MNKKCQLICLLVCSFFCLATVAWGTLPSSKINGKYYLSQSPWSGALSTAITDVNNLNAQVTLVIDANATLSSSLVVDKEVSLEFISGYQITIPNGYTLTINGTINAGLYQIFTDNTTNKNGVMGDPHIEYVFPEWWGAARNVVADSSTAIIQAVKFAQNSYFNRKTIFFSAGIYYVNSPVPLAGGTPYSLGITIKGAGFNVSTICANATISSIFQLTDSNTYDNFSFVDIALNGNVKANYGIYSGSSVVSNLRCKGLSVQSTLLAGVSIGNGICNNFTECRFLYNGDSSHLGHGLEFRAGAYHNIYNIISCIIVANKGFGIFKGNGIQFNVTGCTIEANETCGIGVFLGRSISINNNYFEGNGSAGFTATTPSIQVYSQIFINGLESTTQLSAANSVTGVAINGNYYTNNGLTYPQYFIYAPSLFNAKIENNVTAGSDNTVGELFIQSRSWSTHWFGNVVMDGKKSVYAGNVSGTTVADYLCYMSNSYPATVKIIGTGKNGSTDTKSFEMNVYINGDQSIKGYCIINQSEANVVSGVTITGTSPNAILNLTGLMSADWTFEFK